MSSDKFILRAMKKTRKKLENYPVDCDSCECRMKLKGCWVSGTGMTISLYQCPNCHDIELMQSDEPLFLKGLCPRCGSENIMPSGSDNVCKDCKLIFREISEELPLKGSV